MIKRTLLNTAAVMMLASVATANTSLTQEETYTEGDVIALPNVFPGYTEPGNSCAFANNLGGTLEFKPAVFPAANSFDPTQDWYDSYGSTFSTTRAVSIDVTYYNATKILIQPFMNGSDITTHFLG